MDKELQDFARATHEGFQKMKAAVKAEHALRRAGRVQSAYLVGQEAARAGMPRQWPLDDDVDDDAAGLCAAFFEGFDAANLELQKKANLAALRRNSHGQPLL
jgi:hypothetical protein